MDMKESVIAADITIEGKIVGSGHVRIAGRFKGDVHVDGNLTLDSGAHLEGQVKASVVVVGGELLGNIDNAKRVELLEPGVINGDVKAVLSGFSAGVIAGSELGTAADFGSLSAIGSGLGSAGFVVLNGARSLVRGACAALSTADRRVRLSHGWRL